MQSRAATALRDEPAAHGLKTARRAGGRPDDVTALRGEALAGAEAHVREDAGVGRDLRLPLDALDEVVPEEVSREPHQRVFGDREREVGVEPQALLARPADATRAQPCARTVDVRPGGLRERERIGEVDSVTKAAHGKSRVLAEQGGREEESADWARAGGDSLKRREVFVAEPQ